MIKEKGIALLSINDRAASKQTRTMVCTLLIVIFLAIAAMILVVSIFLSNFRIRSSIEDELAQMGVLKAIGYTSSMIIAGTVMPYVFAGMIATVIGTAVSYAVLPFVAGILAIHIYKAIGYTNRQLTVKTASEFIPVVAVASAISAIAGLWYLPAIDNVIFSLIGAVKNQFEVSVGILIVFAVLFTVVAFGISVLLSVPIK